MFLPASTFTGGAAQVWSDHRLRAAGHGTGDQHAHLTPAVAVTVAAAVVPALALLVALPAGREAVVRGRSRRRGARHTSGL